MALLAKLLSVNYGLPVVTDNHEHDLILRTEDAVYDWADEFHGIPHLRSPSAKPDRSPIDATALLYSVVLPRVGIANLDDVPIRKIIQFRQKYDDERREFADELQALATGLKARPYVGEAELEQYLRESADKLDRKRRRMIAALGGSGIETILKASAVSAPLVAGAAVGSLPGVGAAVASSIGTAAVLYGARRARRSDLLKDSAVSYLFLMEKTFDTPRLIAKLRNVRRWY